MSPWSAWSWGRTFSITASTRRTRWGMVNSDQRKRGRRRPLRAPPRRPSRAAVPTASDLVKDLLDLLVATRAAAAGLGVVGDVLDRREPIGRDDLIDQTGVNAETTADQFALVVVFGQSFTPIVGNGRLERLATHHRAVHLLGRQAVEVVGDVLVRDLQGIVEGHPLDDLGQGRRRSDRRAAAERLEVRVEDPVAAGIDPEQQPEGVAAGDCPDFTHRVRFRQRSRVAWLEEVVLNLLGILPHGAHPLSG